MTDMEINKALAVAIGWREDQIVVIRDRIFIKGMLLFDHADWGVIGPIAEKYKSFPKNVGISWISWFNQCSYCTVADTPQKAIALAVIEGAKHDCTQ